MVEYNSIREHLSEVSREELLHAAVSSIQMMGRLINRVIYLCKFMNMPDKVIQEILLMTDEPEMFDLAMREFYESMDIGGKDSFVIIDLSRGGKDRHDDKNTNSSKNRAWD